MLYIDTHTHLSDQAFDKDREAVAALAAKAGVEKFFEILCSMEDWEKAPLFTGLAGNFYFAVGIHPEFADKFNEDDFAKLKTLAAQPGSIFIGEIGLDYWWDISHKKEQVDLLLKQIAFSAELFRPCVFHCRNGKNSAADNAYRDLLNILKREWKYVGRCGRRGIMHSFSGSWEDAVKSLDMGLYLGINGTFTYPKNEDLRETVRKVGLKNIVFETDCPYLPPQSIRGRRNSPANIPEICMAVADYLGKKVSQTAEEVYTNSLSFIE